MEEILKSLANENSLLPLILITTVSVMICLWKYGGDIMKLFKRENKKDVSDSKYESLVHKVLEDGKERELAIQKVLQDSTRTNKELSETNAKLADMISIRIDTIEEDVKDMKEDMRDVKDSLIIIKTRTEK